MSIPKEPRQLMINLMYLVLTALLALNVSAEVMNAFFSLDKGLKGSREIVDKNNASTLASIATTADAYKNPNNAKYNENAQQAVSIANEFSSYIDGLRTELFNLAKGPSKADATIPKDSRNKDVTTRWLVGDTRKNIEGKGFEIEKKIKDTRAKLLALADNDPEVAKLMTLDVEPTPEGKDAKNWWVENKFRQMPVAAVFPVLGKMQSDAKASASAVLNYCLKKVNGVDIKMDAFEPVISASKGYVIAGEKYEADVFLSAYSTTANNISISAGGAGLPVKDGKAHYSVTANGSGPKKYDVSINVTNPLTKEVKNYRKTFEYEVGQRACSVQLDKMNVFYIGVENPITVSASGVSSNDLKVSASGVNLSGSGSKYTVTANTPGEATLTLSGGGLQPQTFKYRVKRIPNPIAKLGAQYVGGSMADGTFRAQSGIAAVLENFDFDVKCNISGYEVAYLAKRADPILRTNVGATFGSDAKEVISRAKGGDTYYFNDIRAKCPGDAGPRDLGSIVIKIK